MNANSYSSDGYCNNDFGRGIIILHDDGTASQYAHLSSVLVAYGQRVEQGDIIGKVGSTGKSGGPHLHFALSSNKDRYWETTYNNSPASSSYGITYGGSIYANSEGVQYIFKKNNQPTGGCYDISSPRKGVIHISGVAVDPDETNKPVTIHVYIDGQMHQPPYVANKHDDHSQSYNGFDEEIILSSDTTQSHSIKVFALDTLGGNNPQIGEATVTVEADPQPTEQVEITSGPKGMVHVRGWAQDQDAPNKSLEVHVYFGGDKSTTSPHTIISPEETHMTWADIQRKDPGATWTKSRPPVEGADCHRSGPAGP